MQGELNTWKSINRIYHISKINDKNHEHINRCRKSISQNPIPFMIKALKVSREETYLIIIKAIYDKPTATIILNNENWKLFFKTRNKTRMPTPTTSNFLLEVQATRVIKEKEIKACMLEGRGETDTVGRRHIIDRKP